jgi:hypothetical protein
VAIVEVVREVIGEVVSDHSFKAVIKGTASGIMGLHRRLLSANDWALLHISSALLVCVV